MGNRNVAAFKTCLNNDSSDMEDPSDNATLVKVVVKFGNGDARAKHDG